MRFFLLLIVCLVFFPIEGRSENTEKAVPHILLFSCHYGAGHKMATQSILESLSGYPVQVVDTYAEPLRPLDPMRDIFPMLCSEALYNTMLKRECNRLLNGFGCLTLKFFSLQRLKMEQLLREFIEKNQPDMMISCIPLINSMLQTIAREKNLPLLVVTTDIDIAAFCFGFEKNEGIDDLNKFRMTVPFAKESWYADFGRHLPQAVVGSLQYGFGYPTRCAFSEDFETSVLEQLRVEYGIQQEENVILVMMGGNTSQAALAYAKLLLMMTEKEISQILGNLPRKKIRLICLCGDVEKKANASLMKRLNALNYLKGKSNSCVHIQACPGTSRIAAFASLPELCTVISKPGGSTVNEMIKKKVPMIYHIAGVPLDWEYGNMRYGEMHQLGRRLQFDRRMESRIRADFVNALTETFAWHQEIQKGKSIPESTFDFSTNLRMAIQEMCPHEDSK